MENNLLPITKLSIRRSTGFSLIETLVALTIGMLGAIIMLQVYSLSEERQRVATYGGDAQSNGIQVFYQLQSDINKSGYGFNSYTLFGCGAVWKTSSGNVLTNPVPIAPVTINPVSTTGTKLITGNDANTDTLLIMYGNGNSEPEGNAISNVAGTVYSVQMASAYAAGDYVLAGSTGSSACPSGNLMFDQITQAPAPTAVTVATGAAGVSVLFNLGAGTVGAPASTHPNGPTVLAYAIRNGNLTVCDYMVNDCSNAAFNSSAAVWEPVGSNIVSLRAVYMQDTSALHFMDGIPDANGINQTTPTTACGWVRVSAVNIALVSRSLQFNKTVVTNTASNAPSPVNAPAWAEDAVAPLIGTTGTLGPDAAADEPWKHYRYVVFQSVMPIRNVVWMGTKSEC